MNLRKFLICFFSLIWICNVVEARQPDDIDNSKNNNAVTGWRAACVRPTNQTTMEINNVRARLLTGGDIWNINPTQGGYIVPKPAPGQLPVSAIYNGGVWIGGRDRAGGIKVSAVTYRSSGTDYFSGPLDIEGATELNVCNDWDRFFKVSGANVRNHVNNVFRLIETGIPIDKDSISDDVKFWPGRGNPFWRDRYPFNLPDQELGYFWDQDLSGDYDPTKGDFPVIDIRGCEPETIQEARELIPDDMIFWVYNDNGGPQTLSGPNFIQMEVQVQAFAYATNDEINDMTFIRYKLINNAKEDIRDCYFSMWVDPDLGCSDDDMIGCDTTRAGAFNRSRDLAYIYNQDAVDGNSGPNCDGVNTYGEKIPMLGIDYFRGPLGPRVFKRDVNGNIVLDANGDTILLEPEPFSGNQDVLVELGMTSFMYHERQIGGQFPPATTDPQTNREEGFYNYIRGLWRDGTPLTVGGSGYAPGISGLDTTRYAFPGDPNDPQSWNMCTANLPMGDRRTLQATGPLLLQPGATNELIVGVVFVPDVTLPCPDITRLRFADDIAQALFDNCFDITDGPDAPDVTSIELDREIILMFSNESTSNNFNEQYAELDLQAPSVENNKYLFEGYRLYQLASANITPQELGDIEKARQVAQVDLKNDVIEIYNWTGQANPLGPGKPVIWTPTKEVTGGNRGIQKSFRITQDQFALTDRRLINHRQYHYLAIAYAHNDWKQFDVTTGEGQRRAYLEGRNNVRTYSFVPRPIVYEKLNSAYGEGPKVTRISGEGNPGKFLDMDPSMYASILDKSFNGRILYKPGLGPIDAKVVDPLTMKDGKYRLEISGEFRNERSICAYDDNAIWSLIKVKDAGGDSIVLKDRSLKLVKEYIINNLGFSITVGNEADPGASLIRNGAVGATIEYKDENGPKWFNAIKDGGVVAVTELGNASDNRFDFVRTYSGDARGNLSTMGDGFFAPFLSARYEVDTDLPFYLSPAARNFQSIMLTGSNNLIRLRDLNNVDIVFTSNKELWSKCIVVETATDQYKNAPPDGGGFETIDDTDNFDVRRTPSIDKNGNPLNDGTFGFSYFPGYAIDVETGKRLNIFFGENSVYSGENTSILDGNNPIGGDLIFNPSSQIYSPTTNDVRALVAGGQHYIYVTRQEYDECKTLETKLRKGTSTLRKIQGGAAVTWVAFPLGIESVPMLPLEKGLIPNDMTVKLRVSNPYGESRRFNIDKERDCETEGDQPIYEFEFSGKESQSLVTQEEYVGALENVNVVPNPYYAYSAYETSQFTNTIKITNLPAKAIVTIYSIDGSFIQQFNRDERGATLSGVNRPTSTSQVFPDLEWDMRNFKSIPVASGVYLIHIVAPEYNEERTIKWFGIGRKFDPNGL